ncbi:hypothetical protein TorRG33x02_294730, partial [Trema orientale]
MGVYHCSSSAHCRPPLMTRSKVHCQDQLAIEALRPSEPPFASRKLKIAVEKTQFQCREIGLPKFISMRGIT